MTVLAHGKWLPYQPTELPPNAPANALFARREDDQVDWYDYVNSGENFAADTIKLMAIWRDPVGYVVGPAVVDATMLVPAHHIVLEIDDYSGHDPQADFGNKIYDPATQTFSDPPPPAPVEEMEAMITRIVQAELNKAEKRK